MTATLFGFAKKKYRRYNVPGSPCNSLRKRVCREDPRCNYVKYRGCRRSSIRQLQSPGYQEPVKDILNDAVNTAKFKSLKDIAKNVIKNNGSNEKAITAVIQSAVKMRVPQQNIENIVGDAVAIAKVEHVQNAAKSVIKNKGVSHEKIANAATQAAIQAEIPPDEFEQFVDDAVTTAKVEHVKKIAQQSIKQSGGSDDKITAAAIEAAEQMDIPPEIVNPVVNQSVNNAKINHLQKAAKSVIKNKGASRDDALSAVQQAAQDLDIPQEQIDSIADDVVASAEVEHVKDITQQAIKDSGGSHTKTVAAAAREVGKLDNKSFKNKAILLKNAGKLAKKDPVKPIVLPKKSFKQTAATLKNAGKLAKKPVIKPIVLPKKSFKQAAATLKNAGKLAKKPVIKPIVLPKKSFKQAATDIKNAGKLAKKEPVKPIVLPKKSFKQTAATLKNAGKLAKKDPVKPIVLPKKSFKQTAATLKNAGKIAKKPVIKPIVLAKKEPVKPIVKGKTPPTPPPPPPIKKTSAPIAKSKKEPVTLENIKLKKVTPIVKGKTPPTPPPPPPIKKTSVPVAKSKKEPVTLENIKLKKVTPIVKGKTPPTPPPPPPLKKTSAPVAKSKKEPVTLENIKLKKITPIVKGKTPPTPPPPPPLKKTSVPVAKSKKEPITLENVKLKKVKPKTKQPAKKPSIADKYKRTGMDKDLAEKLARRRALSEFGKKRKSVLRKKKINNFEIKYLNNL